MQSLHTSALDLKKQSLISPDGIDVKVHGGNKNGRCKRAAKWRTAFGVMQRLIGIRACCLACRAFAVPVAPHKQLLSFHFLELSPAGGIPAYPSAPSNAVPPLYAVLR